jgi:transposase
MYYLAFDVSKNTLDGVLTNLKTKTEYFQIENSKESINKWLNEIELPKKILAGCESTGNYHLALQNTFVRSGFLFKVINPLLVKQFTRTTIRKKKTDMSDSLIIAKLLSQKEGRAIQENELDVTLKTLQRTLKKISNEKHKFSLIRKSLKYIENNKDVEYLDELLEDLEKSISVKIIEYVCYLESKCSNNEDIKLLESIPGIGFRLALVISTEIGNIDKFNDSKELIAFSGLDPKIRQSGHCLNSQGKLTKRGSPHLRTALFIAASIARRFDPELREYYEKKRKEGKRYTVAICAVSRKMACRVYAVLKRKTPYVKKEVFPVVLIKELSTVDV